jgi:hypothetical protein
MDCCKEALGKEEEKTYLGINSKNSYQVTTRYSGNLAHKQIQETLY